MYKTVIFDVDGTLIDTEVAVINSLQKALMEYRNKEYAFEQLQFVLGIPGARSLKQLGIPDEDIDRVNERWNFFMKEFSHFIKVFPEITELLESLMENKIVVGIVTSKTRKELADDFVPFGLMKYLPHIVCADDTANHKPHPDPILKFLEISGAVPSNSIYIGDTIYDMECAQSSGVDFGLALWGCKNPDSILTQKKLSNPKDIWGLITS
ncbi:HAD family hydrolase [Paenibacillus sp. GCM10012307]|uniref:HAD family hydrolase n=1 Tax=Paenibacillus roseus TaxID=2798579 RepID=A0A934MUH4_9BACL|nr:HAD family hydrolase [Paenibacillus roseus]MBJ6361092.1 HAD family hydrolase [Paenibacillus roseus]